ncbi:MAG: translational GTPase TypA [Proteobacteria bacterium]|jgi:GTP-binding protein|nr:translational GTPase TypA [Pseudomonadota bacterium]MDB4827085.1 translational GTPase TypA [Gammaproteobacteria bacterium]MBT4987614.1 translational GTPase TypA [Pseudomonadota bacterium]MBT5188804.1 translational GTPase TypA [Pseudomonadota bacterium]MBT6069890.1 translational GTPase TypA [Pseudomonadota bacterium]
MHPAITNLRNIAIIAHVDHGKTTLVDQLLQQSGTLSSHGEFAERVMDSNVLERERGITILAKNTAIQWQGWRINIVDTPGHADFGGEVERVLSMVDSVLLLVDAVEGPMPQTRFVTEKALGHGLSPIVVINKVDRPGARPEWAVDQTFDLFDRLGASDEQLDFPVIYASALQGWAANHAEQNGVEDMKALFEAIVTHAPSPSVDPEGAFQMRISALDYSSYVGVIGIGRIQRGQLSRNDTITVAAPDGTSRKGRILQILGFHGLERVETETALAGDIVAVTGLDPLSISDTLCDPATVERLSPLSVDQPTLSMTFQVNDSPFAGREGKFVTSRNLKERLERELIHNVALRVELMDDPDKFRVSGRGELHLSVLIETMRREGYELAISRPEVIMLEEDGKVLEPFETLTVDVEDDYQGRVMERLGERRAEIRDILPDGRGRVRLDYIVPSRGLIGFRSEFLTISSGTGLMYHSFDHYGPRIDGHLAERNNGVLISMASGKALAYALFNLQERGRLFIGHATDVYEGMVIGIHSRSNDLTVNPLKAKQLTNIRAAGTDENILLTPPVSTTLEYALEFINDDELVEVTPKTIRIRKKWLLEHERKRASRAA